MIEKKKCSSGFSLIELLIVVAIVGIIAAVAYPRYGEFVLRAGRAEGAATLLQVMERQELFYRNNLSYTTTLASLGYTGIVASENGRYQVTAASCADATIGRCVVLTAVPQGGQVSAGNMTLNSRGAKGGNWP